MTRSISLFSILVLGIFIARSAAAQPYLVQTTASASPNGGGSGTVSYNGTTATNSLNQGGPVTITYSNAPNTPNLTAATSQLTVTDQLAAGPAVASAYASANLASGTIGAMGSGTFPTASNDGNGDATALLVDNLTFNIPGATNSTNTNIGVSFIVTGSAISEGPAYGFLRSTTFKFGSGILVETYDTADNPPDFIVENSGWTSMQIVSLTENLYSVGGVYTVTGPNPTVTIQLRLAVQCQAGICDYSHTGAFTMTLPAGVTYTSASGVFLTQPPPVCNYTLGPGGQGFPSIGGVASIGVAVGAGCDWSVTGAPSWITFTGPTSGVSNGGIPYTVQPNTGADRSATLTIGGASFVVEQEGVNTGMSLIGSMPHLAAEGGWLTTFTLVNKGPAAAISRTSFFDDSGNMLILPVNLPQQPALPAPFIAASLDQNVASKATVQVQATGPADVAYVEGSAQLAGSGDVDGFAIFHFDPSNQEAVVPLETRNAPSYLLAFDNTNTVLTGIALENVSPNAATVPVLLRDDMGNVLPAASIQVPAFGHFSCVLGQIQACFPAAANIRGTITFVTPPGGQISALGIRYTPPGTLTTIPSLANVGIMGGAMAHIAVNAGWQTSFVLVNTGPAAANATLKFFDDSGNALPLPLTFPQGVIAPQTAATFTQTIQPNATLWAQSVGAAPGAAQAQTGSAQLSVTGNVGGFVIFRYNPNGQEAVVPLESRNAGAYLLAFDNTSQTATGVAISNASANAISVPVIFRDSNGNTLTTGSIALNANGHTSFVLGTQYPQTAGMLGTAEFDAPPGATISVLGIRSPPALTFTTLPPLAD